MRHVWVLCNWKNNPELTIDRRTGLRLRIDKEVNPHLRMACLDFSRWLRREYLFPVRVRVYIKSDRRIRAKDGDSVCGTFWRPDNYLEEPYARIATGDYVDLCEMHGEDNAVIEILLCVAHELTHYFQWINNLELTSRGEERQATRNSYLVVYNYLSQLQGQLLSTSFLYDKYEQQWDRGRFPGLPDPAQLNPESASRGPHPPQAVPLPRARGRLCDTPRAQALGVFWWIKLLIDACFSIIMTSNMGRIGCF